MSLQHMHINKYTNITTCSYLDYNIKYQRHPTLEKGKLLQELRTVFSS